MSRYFIATSFLILTVVSLSACGVVQEKIKINEIHHVKTSANKNIIVNIKSVVDSRSFVLNGDEPSIPQLATVEKIKPSLTATAVAQIRSLSGTTIADIFTEREVITIVKEAIEESFKRAGYTVSESTTDTIPIDVNVVRFWAYNTGSWVFKFNFTITVEINGDLPVLQNTKTFSTSITLSSAWVASSRSYRNTISKGMDKFILELAPHLE